MAEARPRARVVVPFGPQGAERHDVGDEIVVGRSSRHRITLEDRRVSSDHCRVGWDADAGCWMLEDLGSTNGTALDGVQVEVPERLGTLHVITVAGSHRLIFHLVSAAGDERPGIAAGDARPLEQTMIEGLPVPALPSFAAPGEEVTEPPPAAPAAGEVTHAHQWDMLPLPPGFGPPPSEAPPPPREPAAEQAAVLEVTTTDGEVRNFALRPGRHCIGRGSDADLPIDSLHLSRRHMILALEDGRLFVRDLGSSNGTRVDGELIPVETDVEIRVGTALELGNVKIRVVGLAGGDRGGPSS